VDAGIAHVADVHFDPGDVGEGQGRADAELRAEDATETENLVVYLRKDARVVELMAGGVAGKNLLQRGYRQLAGLAPGRQAPDAIGHRIELVVVVA
jgi:hypothetical protein